MSAKKLAIANWKANGNMPSASAWLNGIRAQSSVEVVLCPPALLLAGIKDQAENSNVALGAQDCSQYQPGAFTGELPASLLAQSGCRYVLIGHSERRQLLAEQQDLLAQKCQQALANDLRVVYCIGENLTQREAGDTFAVLLEQLQLLQQVAFSRDNLVVAYEPVWAIGTGKAASSEQAHEVHAFIAQQLEQYELTDTPIVYGGSVKADNCAQLGAHANVQGFLVGGASLQADTFNPIISSL